MKQVAFKMKLKPGYGDEYKKRHDDIWPELKRLFSENGVRDYSIFLDEETNTLFAVQFLEGTDSSQDLAANPLVQRWWQYMADIMDTNSDFSPISISLREVFHMDY
jgi:L-rhamnose mutarotase